MRVPLNLLTINSPDQLAELLGVTYAQLASTVFRTSSSPKYRSFDIPKKSGGVRRIKAPNSRLKQLQRSLTDELYRVHRPHRECAHGFVRGCNIRTNAAPHVGTRYLLNLDLEDYFGSINFGRVYGLFKAPPFRYTSALAAVVANICCDANSLPQGAPTSPVIANMLSSRLDVRLSALARSHRSNYTRYADDISFSFYVPRSLLPRGIVHVDGEAVSLGDDLLSIIEDEGFRPNMSKVRLASRASHMEVTGITVNEFPNVKREYLRQIGSMLYAWERWGHDCAQHDFDRYYDPLRGHRKGAVDIEEVLRGRLNFVRTVRGGRANVYNRLAARFNDLISDTPPLPILDTRTPMEKAEEQLWVIEANEWKGTGVRIVGDMVLTCAHVVLDADGAFRNQVVAFKPTDAIRDDYLLIPLAADGDLDLAAFEFGGARTPILDDSPVAFSLGMPWPEQQVRMLGMPNYQPGDPFHTENTSITRTRSGERLEYFDVGATVLKGMSGGAVLDTSANLVGIIAEHTLSNGGGSNRAIAVGSVVSFLRKHGLASRAGLG